MKEKMLDEELVARAQMGDEESARILYERYKRLIHKIVNGYKAGFLEHDDLFNTCSYHFFINIQRYDETKGLFFREWISRPIRERIFELIRFYSRKKRSGKIVSLNIKATEDGTEIGDLIPDESIKFHIDDTDFTEVIQRLVDEFMDRAPGMILQVFQMNILQGLDIAEIAESLGIERVLATKRLTRMRKLLREIAVELGILNRMPEVKQGRPRKGVAV